jgi:fused signal recognition particle receptor
MEELKKMRRVLDRALPGAPHDIWLVLDATTGQNGVAQVQQFHESLGLTGLVLTKLDGTAKGGIVINIAEQFRLPIRYIGIGEKVDDLRPFDAAEFAAALLEE